MAYIPFQTENADYVFFGSNHIYGRIKPDIFDGIDAMVVEGRDFPKTISEETLRERFLLTSAFGNRDLRRKLREERVPVYSVDVDAKRRVNHAIGMIMLPFSILDLSVSIPYTLSNSRLPRMVHNFSGILERIEASPNGLGRSFLAAKKIDEYVAPNVAEEIVNGRPKIGIIYGTAHQMIVDFLTSVELREKFLKKYQISDFEGFDKDNLDKVMKIQYDEDRGLWVSEEHRARLFNK